jgi:hypothetical protein
MAQKTQFVKTVTEKLMTYALGRGLEYYDAPTVRAIDRAAAADDYRWSSLILEIVKSAPFQMRRAQSPVGQTIAVRRLPCTPREEGRPQTSTVCATQ